MDLLAVALGALAGVWYFLKQIETVSFNHSMLAICLGIIGALDYMFFNFMGSIQERAAGTEDFYTNLLRTLLGGILGWLCYYAIVRDLGQSDQSALLLLPFLAGFSTRLVVGIISQAISAIELTLGLEDKSTELKRRRRNTARGSSRAS